MTRKLESRSALVLAIIALSIALGGNAWAVSQSGGHKIQKGEIANGAVTASALAKGAVTAPKLHKGAVTAPKLKKGAVGEAALANNAVTARAIAPNSVFAYALGPTSTVTAPIKDADTSADLSTWTNSSSASAVCAQGDRVLSGGVNTTNPGNRRVGTIVSVPIVNGATNGWQGEITTDSGGLAEAQVEAECLKAGP